MILANALSDHKADSRWTGAGDFVFSRPDGRPYSQEHLTKIALMQARERAGIPYEKSKTGFGLFRRSLATYLMKQTGLAQAQTQLRHGSATTTALPTCAGMIRSFTTTPP